MRLPGGPQTAVAGPTPNTVDLTATTAQKGGSPMKEPVQPAQPRPRRTPAGRRVVKHFADFLRHVRRRWYLYLPIFAIWGLAYARLSSMRRRGCPCSSTGRRACRIASPGWCDGPHLRRGDFIVFSFDGEAQADYPGCAASPSSRSCGACRAMP